MLAQFITPFADLTREERILTVIAIGGATIVFLHFVLFEIPRHWPEVRDAIRRLRDAARKSLDHPPTRPQWVEEEPESIRRQQLDAVVVPFVRRSR